MLYELPKNELKRLIDYLLEKKFRVIAPVHRNGSTLFDEINSFGEASFPSANTIYSPKNYFLPAQEEMVHFDGHATDETKPVAGKTFLVGLRPCDFFALRVNDAVLLKGTKDPYYAARRENTLVAVFDCATPAPHCFCDSMGYREPRNGFDLLFREGRNSFLISAGSAAGRKIVSGLKLKKSGEKPLPRKPCGKKVLAKALKALEKNFFSPEWRRVAETCLSCGACTAVCPTCNCFEVTDEIARFEGGKTVSRRVRRETSCFFPFFTRVAGGHCLRATRDSRLKQFAYHKMVYFPKEHGAMMCVGCGRCFTTCLKKIDVFETTNRAYAKGGGTK